MIKFIKRLLKLFIIATVLISLAMFSIIYFVNPNQFKGAIEAKVLAQTGHVLTIKGPMNWKLSPTLMLQLEDVTLDNQKPFQNQLFAAKNIRIDLALSSLFCGNLVFNLKLNGVNVSLIRNKEGHSNWESLLKLKPSQNNQLANNVTEASDSTVVSVAKEGLKPIQNTGSSKSLPINSLQIEDGQVTFLDKEKNNHYQIKDVMLTINNIMKGALGIDNPIKLSFEWLNLNNKASGKLNLQADWALNLLKDELNIPNLILKLDLPDNKSSTVNGKINIKTISQSPVISGDIESKNFDIQSWLKKPESGPSALPASANITAHFNYQAPFLVLDNNIQFKDNGTFVSHFKINTSKMPLQNCELQGEFKGEQFKINQIKLDEIKGNIIAKGGVINIAPLSLLIANSQQQATIQIDLRGDQPKYVLSNEAHNFEIKSLLALFRVDNKIEGKTNLKLNLSASGSTAEQISQSLSGNSNIEIQNGKFSGADLITLLKTLNANIYSATSTLAKKPSLNWGTSLQSLQELWKQKQTAINPNASTAFSSLKASLNMQNGNLSNPDLLVQHPEYVINGKGTINLNNKTIAYHASTQLKNNPHPANDDLANYLYSSTLPITISGNLGSPSITPDIKAYANNAFVFAQKNLLQKTVNQEATKVLNKVVENGLDKNIDKNVNKAIESTLNSLLQKAGN